jgi:hypothetical protein
VKRRQSRHLLPVAAAAALALAPAGASVLARPLALARTQAPPSPPSPAAADDTSDLVNSLLAGLLGFGEMGEADLVAEVAEVGRVSFKTPVRFEYMGREGLRRYVADLIEEEYPAAEAEADGRTLVAFDLLPPGTDLRALRARVLEDNVVGFYDERPEKRRLYVVSEDKRLTPMNQLVLAHELRHALQDQYMGVHDLLDAEVSDYDDRQLALLSLLEGDATFVMEKFLLKRMPGGEDAMAALGQDSGVFGLGQMAAAPVPGAPPIVRDQLVLPYFAGRDFVQAVFRRRGFEGMKAAWAQPPASTEQVLHPEKYEAGEMPRWVVLASGPAGSRALREGVLGEALIRTWLGEGSEAAAAGWGGDAFRCSDVGGKTLLVWRTEWDTPSETAEFLAAARKRLAGLAMIEKAGWQVFARGEWRFALTSRSGGVEFVASDSPAVLDAALGRAMALP